MPPRRPARPMGPPYLVEEMPNFRSHEEAKAYLRALAARRAREQAIRDGLVTALPSEKLN